MSTQNSVKLGLIGWTLAMCFVAGCAGNKNKDRDVEDQNQQVGALDPASVEAESLLEGPWCKQANNTQGRSYELRYAYRDSGSVITKAYRMNRGERGAQTGETSKISWRLEGDQLTFMDDKYEIKESARVSFTYTDNTRYMNVDYGAQQSEDFYACP